MNMERKLTVTPADFAGPAKVMTEGRRTVADVYAQREPGDQNQTAALFAAAPDLLAVLRKLTDAIGRMPGNNPLDGLADEARAAIARAEVAK
jgi:hypothetical protein